ncbi:MAG: O-antigen ligase family protein [Robiginitomaculum sp.]|nr:O-antigen ligase family protein [Robiginitomaculum sp.]
MFDWSHEQGWRRPLAISIGFLLIALFIVAGAMGLALGVTLAGLLAIPPLHQLKKLLPLELPLAIFLIFIAWAWLSLRWSTYPQSDQAWKMALGVILYSLFAYAVWSLRGKARLLVLYASAISLLIILLAYFGIAFLGVFSLLYEEGVQINEKVRDSTRGISALVCAVPVGWAFCNMLFPGWRGKLAGALVGVLAFAISWQYGLSTGMLAIIVAGVLFAIGWFYPRTTIMLVGLAAIFSFMMAPMLVSTILGMVDKSVLPDSWAMRVDMWHFVIARIEEKALLGWGLDASRSFTDTYRFKTFDIPNISLHPHNFGLQLWLETGLVGVSLFSAATLMLAIRVASSWNLGRLQGAAIAGSSGAMLVFMFLSFGAWQEWFWACAAWVAAMCFLVGPAPEELTTELPDR